MKRKLAVTFIAIVTTLAILGAGYFVIASSKAEEAIEQAEAALANRNLPRALELYARALEHRPNHTSLLQRYTELLAAQSPREAFDLLQARKVNGRWNDSLEVRRIELAFEVGEVELARTALAAFSDTSPLQAESFYLEGLSALVEQDIQRARERFIQALSLNRELRGAHLLLGRILTDSEKAIGRLQAKQALLAAFEGNDHIALQAGLALLRGDLLLQADERLDVVSKLEQNPFAHRNIQLSLLAIRARMDPESTSSIYEGAADLMAGDPLALAQWYNQMGAYDETEKLALAHPDATGLQEAHFRALLAQNRLEEARTLLLESPHDFQEADRLMWLAAFAVDRGEAAEASAYWEDAFAKAETESPVAALILARHAYRVGWKQKAWRAFSAALADEAVAGTTSDEVWKEYLETSFSTGDLSHAQEAAKLHLQYNPESIDSLNNTAYLAMLLDQPAIWEPLWKRLDTRFAESVDAIHAASYANTIALGYHLTGNARQARAIIEQTTHEWSRLGDSNKAVYAAVLQATHETEQATRVAESINRLSVLPAEWDLVRNLVRR